MDNEQFVCVLQEKMVRAIAAHKMFHTITYDYDIALIRLAEELTFNDFVRPVCLPSMEEPLEQTSLCVVTGWGSLTEGGCSWHQSCNGPHLSSV